MFGDNQAVVNNSAIPLSIFSKRHNALSYHRVCEAIDPKVDTLFWVNGKDNPADIVRKHWANPQIWHMLQRILFYSGNTGLLTEKEKVNARKFRKSKNFRYRTLDLLPQIS
jgi:hypothetical protein